MVLRANVASWLLLIFLISVGGYAGYVLHQDSTTWWHVSYSVLSGMFVVGWLATLRMTSCVDCDSQFVFKEFMLRKRADEYECQGHCMQPGAMGAVELEVYATRTIYIFSVLAATMLAAVAILSLWYDHNPPFTGRITMLCILVIIPQLWTLRAQNGVTHDKKHAYLLGGLGMVQATALAYLTVAVVMTPLNAVLLACFIVFLGKHLFFDSINYSMTQ